MKSISLIKLAAFVCVGSIASIAFSANSNSLKLTQLEQGASISDDFKSVDLNKDGELSKAEVITGAKKYLKSAFNDIDKDKDGVLKLNEVETYFAAMNKKK